MVGALGLFLAVGGTLLTVAGFGITIWQLVRTQRSAEAARVATDELKLRLAGQSAAIHSASGQVRLKTALRELRSKNWAAALDAIDELREILFLLHRKTNHVSEQTRQQLLPYLKDLGDYVSHLEKHVISGITDTKRTQMTRRLRDLSTVLVSLSDDLSESTR